MKVMICSDLASPYVGGAESYVIGLASRLAKKHEVCWLTSRLPKTKTRENFRGIKICRVPIFLPYHYLFPGRQTFPLASLLPAIKLARKMDILQFDTFVAATFGWFVAKFSNKPSVLFCHEMFNGLWKTMGQNWFEKNTYPQIEKYIANLPYDWFICPSEHSKRTLTRAGAKKERISVIPHGIDFNLFNKKNNGINLKKQFGLDGYKLVGFTGRLTVRGVGQSKNLIGLIKAMNYVIKEIPDAKLILGGTGFENLLPFVKKLRLEKYVTYLGSRSYEEVPNFLALCDVVACPALAEGYCFLLAEAAACGKPLVATNLGAHPERIINNKTGILTNPNPRELAEGIIKLLDDTSLAKKLGNNGAKFAKNFSWDLSVKKHLEIYEMLLH